MRSKTRPSLDIEEEEARCTQIYTKALSMMGAENSDPEAISTARDTFEDLLRTPFLRNMENEKFSKVHRMLRHLIHKNLVAIYEKEESYENALDCAKMALDADNSDAVLFFKAGRLVLKKKNYPEAAFYLKRCIEIIPSHWDALNTLLETLFVLNEFDECERIADKCLIYYPDNQKALVLKSYFARECSFSPKLDQETLIEMTDEMSKWLEKLIEVKEMYSSSDMQLCEDVSMAQEVVMVVDERKTKKVSLKSLSWCELVTALTDRIKLFRLDDTVEFDTKRLSRSLSDGGSKKCEQEETEPADPTKKDDDTRRATRKVSNLKGPFELQKLLMDNGIVTEELLSETERVRTKPEQSSSQPVGTSEDEECEVFDFIDEENNKTLFEFGRKLFEKFFFGSKHNPWNDASIKPLIALHNFISSNSCNVIEKNNEIENVNKTDEIRKAEELVIQYKIAYGHENDFAATIRIFWLKSRIASIFKDRYAEFSEMKKALLLMEHRRDVNPDSESLKVLLPHCKKSLSILSEENIKAYVKDEELINGFATMNATDEDRAKITIEKLGHILTSGSDSGSQRLEKIKALKNAYEIIGDHAGCVGCLAEELFACEPHDSNYMKHVEKILKAIEKSIVKCKKGMIAKRTENILLCAIYNVLGNCAQDEAKRLELLEKSVVTLAFEVITAFIGISSLKETINLHKRIVFFSELHKFLDKRKLCETTINIHKRYIETLTDFPAPQNCDDWDDWEERVIEPETGIGITEWTKMYSNCVYCITHKIIYEQCPRKDKLKSANERVFRDPKFLSRYFFVTSFLMDESSYMKKAFRDVEDYVLRTFRTKEFKHKKYVDSIKLNDDSTFSQEIINETNALLSEAKEKSNDNLNYSEDRFEAFTREKMYMLYNVFGEGVRTEEKLKMAIYVNPVDVKNWELLGDYYKKRLYMELDVKKNVQHDDHNKLISIYKNAETCFMHSINNIKVDANEEKDYFYLILMKYWIGKSRGMSEEIRTLRGDIDTCISRYPNRWEFIILAGKCEAKISPDISSVLRVYHTALKTIEGIDLKKDEQSLATSICKYYVYATRTKYIMNGGDVATLNKIEDTSFASDVEVLNDALENGFKPILESKYSRHKALKMACEIWLHGPPGVQSPVNAVNALDQNIKLLQGNTFETLIKADKGDYVSALFMPWEYKACKRKILMLYVEALSLQNGIKRLRTLYESSAVGDEPEVLSKIREETYKYIEAELNVPSVVSEEPSTDGSEKIAKAKDLLVYINIVGFDKKYENVLRGAYRNYTLAVNNKEPDPGCTIEEILWLCNSISPRKRTSSGKLPKSKKPKTN